MTSPNKKKNAPGRTVRQQTEERWSCRRAPGSASRTKAYLAVIFTSALVWTSTACSDSIGQPGQAMADSDRQPHETTVGFVTGHGEPSLDGQLSGVAEALGRTRSVVEVRLASGAESLLGVDVVVVAGAPDIPDAELYVLDQFLMLGGRVAFLLDAAVIPDAGTQANLSAGNIFGFLSAYGLTVNPDLVLDNTCSDGVSWGDLSSSAPYPYWPVAEGSGVASEHPALAGRTAVPMAWTSSITTRGTGPGSTRSSVLLRSSSEAWAVSAFADIDPSGSFEPPDESGDVHRVAGAAGFPLAVVVEGSFASAFAGQQVIVQRGKEVEFTDPEGMVERGAPTRVVVFGSSMMFRDDLASQLPGGADLLADVVDWLAAGVTSPADEVDHAAASDWTPRRLALVVVVIAGLGVAAVLISGATSRRRNRSSST